MLNRIIRFSLNNRLIVLVLSCLIMVAGVIALLRSDVDIFPDLNAPTVTVMTEAPGYAPEEVEQLITFPLETAVNGATGVRRVRSSSATGYSVVNVEFDWNTDVYVARQTVAERIAGVSESFPAGVGSPTLGPQSSILGEVLIIGLTSDSVSMMDLRSIADRVIRPRLLSVQGVSQVNVMGGEVKEMQVRLNSALMKHYDVTLDAVVEACEAMTVNATGSIINDYGNEYIVKGLLSSNDAEQLASNVVDSGSGALVTLGDIAEVEIAPETPCIGKGSVEGKPAVLITVTKQPHVGTIDLNANLLSALDKIRLTLPRDINISTDIFSQSTFIENSITNLQQSLLEGSLFVIIVLFFFLMNLRTTLISIVAMPMAVLVTVLVLKLLDININTMTLGGIAIAIGSLVDDAIVDVENVYKRLRANRQLPPSEHLEPREVVYKASQEVRMPVLNSTLIILASFLPLFFLDGVEGRMLIPLGVSFVVSLIASTVVALTLTPALCSYLLEGKATDRRLDKEPLVTRSLKSVYDKALNGALNHKKLFIGCTTCLFLLSLGLFFTLGRSFLPSFNEGSFTINVSTLPGVSIEESDRIGRLAEQMILSVPEVQTVARKTGRAELDEHALGSNVSEIEAPYKLKGRRRGEVARELREKLSKLPGCNIEIGQPISHRIDAMLSGTEAQIAVKLFGDDLSVLHAKGTDIKNLIKDVEGVVDANIEQQIERPEIEIRPRREILKRYGISMSRFSQFISTAMAGRQVSYLYDGGFPYNLTVKLDPREYSRIDALQDILVDSKEGKVPLGQLAEIVSTTGPNTINREDVNRRIVISANVEDRDLRSVVNDINKLISEQISLPEGYVVKIGGQFESEAAASRTLMLLSILSVFIIFLLLYAEFKNISESLIILVNMPLALIGGVLILVITGSDLNIPAIIGFISLMGISTRNGMLLINRYNRLKNDGVGLKDRVVRGSVDRLTPIMMTALTSTLALIPLALRGGEAGNEIQAPMAIVILGGLTSSTLLNLFIVPIIYTLNNSKKGR